MEREKTVIHTTLACPPRKTPQQAENWLRGAGWLTFALLVSLVLIGRADFALMVFVGLVLGVSVSYWHMIARSTIPQ